MRLPNPPEVYDRSWADQYARILEQANQELLNTLQSLKLNIAPNYTTAERTSLDDRPGQVVFDTDIGKLFVNTGAGWEQVTSV